MPRPYKSNMMLYFAYGSNMSSRRLRGRVPSAKAIRIGYIQGYRLTFDKVSADGSGKCDAEETGNPQDRIFGVIYEIPAEEKGALDEAEGLGHGYEERTVTVFTDSGEQAAVTYYATNKDKQLRPYGWYKAHVLAGAREHGLPKDYIAKIEQVEVLDDPDKERVERELAIYRD